MANAAKTNGSTVMRVPTVHDPVADAAKPKSTRERPVSWSALHPMIPRHYVPAWQQDMVNGPRLVQRAKRADCPGWEGHHALFLEKRERSHPNAEPATERFANTDRGEQIRPPISSHLSRYTSSLLNCKH